MALYAEDRMDLTTLFPEVGMPRWEDLPIAMRKFVSRTARLQRLVSLGAPAIVVNNERHLVAESYVDLGEWLNHSTIDPAREYTNGLFEAEMKALPHSHEPTETCSGVHPLDSPCEEES